MNQGNGVVQMSEISFRQKISLKYLEQVIRPIKNAGFVTSRRGRKGGHRLAGNPEKITLAQIVRIFEKEHEPIEPDEDHEGYSQYQDALIRQAWNEALDAFYNKLGKVTLADLSIDTTKKLWKSSELLIFT